MYRKDYIQRKIDELGKALARLLAELKLLKEQGQVQEAIEHALNGLKEQADIDLAETLTTPNEQLLQKLVQEREYTHEHLKLLADIIYEYACETDEPTRHQVLQKCLTLYNHIVATETETIHFEMLQRINGIKAEVG